MPRISEFLGLVISMFYNDHVPPHFHAVYGQYEAIVGIDPIRVLNGQLPRRVQSLVIEWAALYQNELREDWELARAKQPLKRIPPLE
ncbi:MAG: DUF4160 domain-containing protein [Herpetosiphonaceae bacterium]|nr:DUF4160 domain-containing protein [Herpetosiphonaceae bacterium]